MNQVSSKCGWSRSPQAGSCPGTGLKSPWPRHTTGEESDEHVPDLFGIAELDLRPLLHKLAVAFHKLNAPVGVLLQVIKLVLECPKERKGGIEPRTTRYLHVADQNNNRITVMSS